jgi:hypothetical protein
MTFPVAAFSAKAAVDVSPYTTPLATATPSGPGPDFSGMFTWYSHVSCPVASEIAYTLASRSCMYTVPFTTTGAAANEPAPDTPFAAVPVSLNVHASFSWETFADEICAPVTSLVLARFPLGSAHDPAGRAAPANALPVPVGADELHPDAIRAAALAMASVSPYLARCRIKTTFLLLPSCHGLLQPYAAS